MNITIFDQLGNHIGDRFKATNEEIKKYIEKGFKVINLCTHEEITESTLYSMIGVSDGLISTI